MSNSDKRQPAREHGPSGSLHVANLRHDLLTPVNHIIGYGEMLVESAEEDGKESLLADLERLVARGRDLISLIRNSVREETFLAGEAAVDQARQKIGAKVAEVIDLCQVIKNTATSDLDPSFHDDMDRIRNAAQTLCDGVNQNLKPGAARPVAGPKASIQPDDDRPVLMPIAENHQGARILFVDDIPANRDLMQRRLSELGYAGDVAENGEVALEKLRESSFDLVLLDIVMPVMDGHEVLAAMKNDPVLCGIPVIMVSALSELDEVVACVKLGADDYLGKDFNPMLLKNRIDGCLESQRAKLRAKQLGSYVLTRQVGKGGMGEVYLASHVLLRRPTAVKLLKPDRVSKQSIANFHREVQLTSQLTHPNTIAVYDYGQTPEGRFYFAMEYLEGMDLSNLVRCLGPIGEARTRHILLQVCASLAEAHDHGLIHRDIKPANIMLCERGGIPDFVKVLDFGIAREMTAEETGGVREIVGTPQYMSPESIHSPEKVDARSDIYAVGCVGHYLLAGEPVFGWLDQRGQLEAHIHEDPPLVSKVVGHSVSDDLERLLLKCLSKDPRERPQSATELLMALNTCKVCDAWTEDHMHDWWRRHRPAKATAVSPGPLDETDVLAFEIDLESRVDESTMQTKVELD